MRGVRSIVAATFMVLPHSAAAAEMALACVFTDEDIVYVPASPPGTPASPSGTLSVHRQIAGETELAIKQSVLLTPAGSPCDRIAGAITHTLVDVSCSFPPQGIGRAALAIRIDLDRGTIVETWDTIEHDGSQSHFAKHGTCTFGEPPRIAERSSPANEPTALIAAR